MTHAAQRRATVRGRTAVAGAVLVALTAGGLVAAGMSTSQAATLNTNALFVSPTGTTGAAGTQSAPTTLASAITRITPGGTIYLRGGTYPQSATIKVAVGNDGTSSARKEISAYPGETPVLNFAAQALDSSNRGLVLNGDYWHVYGIVVEHAGDNGIYVGGSNNVVERTITRYNRDTGLQLGRASSSTARSDWPANNLIVSSESHDNADPDGEDADGFAAKLTVGPGNVFRYDVSHNNIDDGWDLYAKPATGPIDPVTIEDSLSYENGTLSDGSQAGAGDRNGYKLGGSDIAVNHVIRRSIAYRNGKHGLTYNSNPGSITVADDVSIDNAEGRNFAFDVGTHVFTGNTSCRSGSGMNDKTVGTVGSGNQFWSGTNGSRCSAYSGAMTWSFDDNGGLVVKFGGSAVTTPTATGTTTATSTSTATATSTTSTATSTTSTATSTTTTATSTTTTSTPGGQVFGDNFEDGDTAGWTFDGGSWAVRSSGSLVLAQSGSGTAVALAGPTLTDTNVRAAVRLTGTTGSGGLVAVAARSQDASNGYLLTLRDANKVELRRVVAGKSKVIAKTSFAVQTGKAYALVLDVKGSTLTGYVNNVQQVTATDTTFASGRAGVATVNATGQFDNVSVRTP